MSSRFVLALALIVAVVLAAAASLAIGSRSVPLSEVLAALGGDRTGDALLVSSLRVPRTELGLLVGLALGAAGALAQELTRNPLADPGLLGVSAGAAVAVAAGIALLGLASPYEYVWLAFAGAAIAGLIVHGLGAAGAGGAAPVKLALAGAAVTALLTSLTSALVLLDVRTLDQYRIWAVGSLARREADLAGQIAPFMAVGLVIAVALTRRLNALALGDELAATLGTRVRATWALGAVAITILTGAAVAAAGPIAFVGLVVPHAVRAAVGADARWLVPCSALAGAALLLAGDVLGRVLAPPSEIDVAVVTAFIGGPFLVALVVAGKLDRAAAA